MRNLFILAVLILFVAAPAMAQETPQAEFFGGYEYERLNPGGVNCHGFGANAAYNFNNWLGGVADFGICNAPDAGFHNATYLFGPRVSYRSYGSLTPFGQLLIGDDHVAGGGSASDSFALTLGGGADYKLTDHVSLRGQVEYLHTHFGGTGQNNARIEAGIVYRWGRR
jgi:opacity protein-like surface antigen